MRDIGISPEDVDAAVLVQPASGFALEVIGRLIQSKMSGAARVLDHLVDQLVDAVRDLDARAVQATLGDLRRARVSDEVLVTQYIPEAARRLGEGWNNDSLSFLDVTLGTARLSDLVRDVGDTWHGDDAPGRSDGAVLLLVPPGEQHTLGASVLACQLRLKGVTVNLQLAPSLTDLAALLAMRKFDGALVTVGSHEKVETCAVLVKTLHALSKGSLPVAVGGAVVEEERDLLQNIGAELVSNDLDAALRLFGIRTSQNT